MISLGQLLKRQSKALAERVFGITIYRTLPRGIDSLYDLEQLVPHWKPAIIFDVGANVGQSAVMYARRFSASRILSFEPSAATFQQLTQNVATFRNVECVRLALAAQAGAGRLAHGEHSDMNRVVSGQTGETDGAEPVVLQTLDGFCGQRAVQKIHYLKIDTEGADLDVLRGAERMLRGALIDVVEVEVGIGLDNELHVPLAEFRGHLEARGYQVFGFYEQVHEWKRQLPHLRRTNVVFISPAMAQPLR